MKTVKLRDFEIGGDKLTIIAGPCAAESQEILDETAKGLKEITKKLRQHLEENSKKVFKSPEVIELPKQKLEIEYEKQNIVDAYSNIVRINEEKQNENAQNIEKIAITDKYTVASKVKDMLKELVRRPKFIFNTLFSLNRCEKEEVVTAFSGLLELSRRSKVITSQEELFGDISVEKYK